MSYIQSRPRTHRSDNEAPINKGASRGKGLNRHLTKDGILIRSKYKYVLRLYKCNVELFPRKDGYSQVVYEKNVIINHYCKYLFILSSRSLYFSLILGCNSCLSFWAYKSQSV